MPPEERLRLAEYFLSTEVDHLERYNRLLDRPTEPTLAELARQFRDEQIRRISLLQQHIQSVRLSLEAPP